jgi:hypothetical protein
MPEAAAEMKGNYAGIKTSSQHFLSVFEDLKILNYAYGSLPSVKQEEARDRRRGQCLIQGHSSDAQIAEFYPILANAHHDREMHWNHS